MTKDNSDNNNMKMVGAGVAGAIIGAGVAVAAEHVLSDEKAMAKAKEFVGKVGDQIANAVGDTVAEGEELKEAGDKAVKDLKKS